MMRGKRRHVKTFMLNKSLENLVRLDAQLPGQDVEELASFSVEMWNFRGSWRHPFLNDADFRMIQEPPTLTNLRPIIMLYILRGDRLHPRREHSNGIRYKVKGTPELRPLFGVAFSSLRSDKDVQAFAGFEERFQT